MIDVLTAIWQRVIKRPSIGMEENFFDLGGNPSMARDLTAEISREWGKFLPPEILYQASTIAALSRLLQQPDAPTLAPVALLRAGSGIPPVFLVHGLGGSVMEFFDLVQFIDTNRSIYGLQARGNDGVQEPFDRIEDLADYHLAAIKTVQRDGPYSLIGYSLGGLVTLEMARRLSSRREAVSLLALLESYPHPDQLALSQRLRLDARRVLSVRRPPAGTNMHLKAPAAAYNRAYQAWKQYQPRAYRRKVHFIRARKRTSYPDDPFAIWGKLLPHIEVQTVAGDHHEILTKYFEDLGSLLSRYLIETATATP